MSPLTDRFGRKIEYLRLSVTDRCNLRCRYCLPAEGLPEHREVLDSAELDAVVQAAVAAGVRSVRLTGGEPLLRPGIVGLVAALSRSEGLDDLSLTSNGTLLPGLAEPLRRAGLRRINLGIPSLDPGRWAELTRGSPEQAAAARQGLEAALEAGFAPVKVNVTVLRELDEDPTPWLELTSRRPVEVRFIEYMPLGPAEHAGSYLAAPEIEARLQRAAGPGVLRPAEPLPGRGPAQRAWQLPGAPGRLAVLAPLAEQGAGGFCARCNRLRLSSDGFLRSCLFSGEELDIKGALRPSLDPHRLQVLLEEAVQRKPAGSRQAGSPGKRRMAQIGG